jgi:chaperonin GroES
MIKPLEDKVVVQPILESERKTSSGLIVTQSVAEVPDTAKVLAVGTGLTLQDGTVVPLNVKVGDTIVYTKYSGTQVEYDSEKFLILAYRDILAVIEDNYA